MIGGNYNNEPVKFGASHISNAGLAANTPLTIVAPAANTNGLIVWMAEIVGGNGTDLQVMASLLAKTSAPVNVIDGIPIAMPNGALVTNGTYCVSLRHPVFVPAGYGLYFISGRTEVLALRGITYTLL